VAQPAQNRAVEGDEYFLGGANISTLSRQQYLVRHTTSRRT